MRQIILFKNGVSIKAFSHQGPMHKYVNDERAKDWHVRFWAMEDGKLSYHYRTQKEIEEEHELKIQIDRLEDLLNDCRHGLTE